MPQNPLAPWPNLQVTSKIWLILGSTAEFSKSLTDSLDKLQVSRIFCQTEICFWKIYPLPQQKLKYFRLFGLKCRKIR